MKKTRFSEATAVFRHIAAAMAALTRCLLLMLAVVAAMPANIAYAAITPCGDVIPVDPGTWTIDTTGCVGNTDSGTVTIDSGTLSSLYGLIGNKNGATGLVTVSGSGSAWRNQNDLYVGNSGTGVVNIINGGSVSDGGNVYLGNAAGSAGSLTVSGSTCTASYLCVGNSGSGALNISNGGSISAGNTLDVAYRSGSSGAVNFGPGGGTLTAVTLHASPTQLSGTGTINIRGLVSDVDLLFDSSHGLSQRLPGFGNVTLNLDMSNPINPGDLGAGYYGNGSLTIKDGFALKSLWGLLGYQPGSSGTATVDGPGSKWTCSVENYVGYYGDGVLNVQNGGSITVAYLFAGCYGNGTISFSSGGCGSATHAVYVAYRSGSTGTINLDAGGRLILKSLIGGSGTAAFDFGGGTMQASGGFGSGLPMTLTGIGGNATVDTAGYAVKFTGPLSGIGGLNKLGNNTLTLAATNTYSGNTTVSNGTLLLDTLGSLLLDINEGANSLLSIAPGAKLDLFGTINLGISDVSATAESWTLVDNAGTTLYEPSFSLQILGGPAFTPQTDDVWTCANGLRYWTFTESTGILSLSPVPEPCAWLLFLSGAITVLLAPQWRKLGSQRVPTR